MPDNHELLKTLAIVLCLAALTTIVFQRLRQPVVFGYLLAGMIAGPHIQIPLVADEATVRVLSELGVILLMFSLGLEFSIRSLIRVAPRAGLVAIAQCTVLLWLGYASAQALGWTRLESFYAGAMIAISSTTIIVKAFDEQKVRGSFVDLVLGVLIMEDLIAILLVAVLTAISSGAGVSVAQLGVTGVRLASFLAMLLLVGLLVVPRLIRAVVRVGSPETTLLVAIGICFAAALLALSFGYSVALGAFIAGSLTAESGHEKAIEQLVRPVRDVFAAIFFVSVGMMIDPAVIATYWKPVLLFTGLVIAGNVIVVPVASFLTGHGTRTSVQAGMSLAQIGEFSFIIAGVGLAAGATRPHVYQVAVAVSAITTMTTPWLIRYSTPVAAWVDRVLPAPVQTLAALYGTWIERLRSAPVAPAKRTRGRHLIELALLDAAVLAGVIIGAALEMGRFTALMREWTGAPDAAARLIVIAVAAVLAAPLLLGLVRVARLLGLELATRVMPEVAAGKVDTAEAPRRALVVTLQLAILSGFGLPLLAVTHPFVPQFRLGLVFLVLLVILGVTFWRSATNLQGHARAGAEVIVGALSRQMASPNLRVAEMQAAMEQMHAMLPGLGDPQPVSIGAASPAAGKTLGSLDLRGLTGATVLAIMRQGDQVLSPSGRVVLQAGDVLAVAGTRDAVEAARALVANG